MIWAGLGRVPNPQTDVPAIVVEFVSRRHRDRVRDEVKRREYLAIGVLEYWVIDRFRRIMTVSAAGRAGRASRTGPQGERGLSHAASGRIRAASGPALEGGRRLGCAAKARKPSRGGKA